MKTSSFFLFVDNVTCTSVAYALTNDLIMFVIVINVNFVAYNM